ncbi:MAG: PGF-CTERM sorting domain-containing protein [Candidatus Methanoperedens sp.]|nr:PGF-CTERM sorting domain-containing protein [Candidatus Methanoperedens sp.]
MTSRGVNIGMFLDGVIMSSTGKRSFVSVIVGILNFSTVLKNMKFARTFAIFSLSALVLAGMAGTGAAVSGLVAEWHFDGSAQDTSGSGNNGTINGATFVQGISGQALSFNGVDNMVVVPHSPSLSLEKYTLEAWIKKDQNRGSETILIKRYGPSWMDNYGLSISPNGTVGASFYSPDIWTWFGLESVRNISAGNWYHIAATYDRTALKIYINGVLDNSVNTQYTPYQNNQQLVIGRACVGDPCVFSPSSPSFNGIIDEVRIYNRALSASEIQAEYNALTSTPIPTTVPPTTVPPTTVIPTTVPSTTVPPTTPSTPAKFRVGPSVTLRPVTDVIDTNQDGIVELFMNNPSLNDVTLNVDARISVPSGIHVYGQSFGEAAGAGVVAGTFSVPPGTSRTISLTIKADKSARIGSHTLSFTGLYWPDDNKDNYQPLSLTYSVTVKEPSKKPGESSQEAQVTATPSKIPGFGVVLAIFGVFAIARLLSRKK